MIDVTQWGRGRGALGVAMAAFALLVAAVTLTPFAAATSEPLASGTTTITLGKSLTNKLRKTGVKLTATKPATVKGGSIALPVASGSIDPANGRGTLVHGGGFKFKRGKKSAAISELALDTGAGSLLAKLAGKRVRFASVEGVSAARDGFGTNLAVSRLKLTAAAAKALNRKLGFSLKAKPRRKGKASASKGPAAPFKANLAIGGSVSETEPSAVTVVASGLARLVPLSKAELENSFAVAEVKPEATPPASMGSEEIPASQFPISGGSIAPDGSAGSVQTEGSVAFVQEPESGQRVWVSFGGYAIDFTSRTVTAEVAAESNDAENLPTVGKLGRRVVADLDMSKAVLKPDPAARTIAVDGVKTRIRGDIAELMNSTYKKGDAFEAGDTLGTFSFTLQAQ